MAFFVVAYDLVEEGAKERDYNGLVRDLKSLDSCRAQKSVWYVSGDYTDVDLLMRLKRFLHKKDRLMAIEFTKRPRYTYALKGTNAWIQRHFPG